MRNIAWLLLLLSIFGSSGIAQTKNQAEYTLSVHVVSSQIVQVCGSVNFGSSGCYLAQQLAVTTNGKRYDLQATHKSGGKGVLAIGDYKARVTKEERPSSWELLRTYELLLPDNTTRSFTLVGESE